MMEYLIMSRTEAFLFSISVVCIIVLLASIAANYDVISENISDLFYNEDEE